MISQAPPRRDSDRRKIRADQRGNVAMIFAFALIPLTFAVGTAIDYARAARLQTKLNAASDAAALSGTTKPMLDQPLLAACNRALQTFANEAVYNTSGLTLASKTPAITIKETYPSGTSVTVACPNPGVTPPTIFTPPRVREITVTYSAKSKNAFGGVLGSSDITIGGTATASSQSADYIDIHMALDTSQSMGLAATDEDAKRLWIATGQMNGRSCQFGCHSRSPGEPYSMEEIARRPDVNARMRIDVLRDATIAMIDDAMSSPDGGSRYRFALYRIGKNAGRYGAGVDEYAKLSSNLGAIKTKVSGLTLSANDGSVGFGDTDLGGTTTFVRSKISANKSKDDGSTQNFARKFFFIVTDGLADIEGWCTWGHCTAPINPTTCQTFKDAGITVGIVYTTYLPVKADPLNPMNNQLRDEYNVMVAPVASQIKPKLQECASSGWFFEASDGPSIQNAMKNLFDQASKSPRLTS